MLRKPHYCILLVLWFMTTTVLAAPPEGKGKEDESLPNVRYSIDRVPTLASNGGFSDMNNLSMFIGYYYDNTTGSHAFLYDHPTGAFYDIRAIDSLAAQVEQLSPGYRFSRLRSINDLGQITGWIHHAPSQYNRGVVIETFLSLDPADWVVSLLPDLGEPGTFGSYGHRINDHGDILGVYFHSGSGNLRSLYLYNPWLDTTETPRPPVLLGVNVDNISYLWLNNHAQVAGSLEDQSLFLYDPTTEPPTLEVFDIGAEDGVNGNQVGGLNDSGVISGVIVNHQFDGKGKRNDIVYRFTNQLEVVAKEGPWSAGSARINSSNDVVYTVSSSSEGVGVMLVHTGFFPDFAEQSWNIKELIAADDPNRDLYVSDDWSVSTFSNRSDATGFPQIAVNAGNETVILTPFIPDP